MLIVRHLRARGFTLIELLVVVTIIALLISILLPTLGRVRDTSKLAVCGSNLRQIGFGIQTYANSNADYIPRGPEPAYPPEVGPDLTGNLIATNQMWIGAEPWYPPRNQRHFHGLGQLLVTACPNPKVFFCPSDNNFNLSHSEPKIGSDQSAYGSYLYRQLDHLAEDFSAGKLDRLGTNEVDGVPIRVETLAMDTNSLGPKPHYYHTNHKAEFSNVLYRDASVQRYANRDNSLALPPEAFEGVPMNWDGVLAALDQLLTNTDYAYRGGHPAEAPRLEQSE
ncbi:MAG: prepilin-type N-terminal cleavage/methylation domain-containing protein [Phycisphaerae bacterium]|nr:prepilin-type N-terminal cleavage/methylation domain-containing protein [Phycisphaerae bacterium]